VPEAKINSLRTKDGLQNLNVLFYILAEDIIFSENIGKYSQVYLDDVVAYNNQVHNSPKTADLVHSLERTKMIDSFAHNLGNLKPILKIGQTRYLDNMDKSRMDS